MKEAKSKRKKWANENEERNEWIKNKRIKCYDIEMKVKYFVRVEKERYAHNIENKIM